MKTDISGWSQVACDDLKRQEHQTRFSIIIVCWERKVCGSCVYCAIHFAGAIEAKLGKAK